MPTSSQRIELNKITFYEQVGIVIPGAALMFGLVLYSPVLQSVLTKEGVTVGELGIFLLLSYAAGHLVAAVGNAGEAPFWWMLGGIPSDWVTRTEPQLLSAPQIDLLESKVSKRLNVKIERIRGLDRKLWSPISRQIYADVAKNGKPDRIDTFNGNYGLNRGLAAASFILACVSAALNHWSISLGLLVLSAVYVYRAYRFAISYARELYLQFLVLSDMESKVVERQEDHPR